jgi:hypothetical protein
MAAIVELAKQRNLKFSSSSAAIYHTLKHTNKELSEYLTNMRRCGEQYLEAAWNCILEGPWESALSQDGTILTFIFGTKNCHCAIANVNLNSRTAYLATYYHP